MDALRRSVWATGGEEGQAGGEGRSTVGKAEGGLVGPASPSREAPVGHRHRRQVRCCRGQGYRRIARNALVSKSDRCGSAERPGRGHGPALDIPARLAYLPSLTIILDLRTFIGGGIPMMRDELVGSVVLGAMAALISMLVWGRSLVDLIAAGT